jgi:hypothetical protein
MDDLDGYKRDQDLLFQELWEREHTMTKATAEEFVRQAERAGYTVDDLLNILDSGMSVPDFTRAVLSKLPEYREQQAGS